MRENDNLNIEGGFTLKTVILASSAIATGIVIIILLIIAVCTSCSNKTYTPTNTTSVNTYTPPVTTTTTQDVEVPVDDYSNDWATLYTSESSNGLVVLDYRDPDTGVHYLYFWKRSNGEIEIVPRLANSNGTIMQD